jgi:hypothetical protein
LRDRYERIIVVGDGAAEAPTSRLLADTERLFTVEAVAQYLARLAEPRGVLLLRVARPHLADLLATASAAADPDSLAERAVACAERKDDGVAGLLILASKLNGPERHNLEKTCKRKGLSVEFPTGEAHNGDRDREAKQRELDASLAKLRAGVAVRDDRPFLDRVPPLVDLRRAAREALRAMPARVPPKAKSKDQEASDPPPPKLTSAGIAMSAAGIAATLLLLALAAPIARGFRGAAPIPFRCAVPLFGIATGVSMVALADHLLRWLGSGDWAWPIVIPLAAIGLGIGRLLADCTREGMLARVTALSALGGAGVLGVLAVAGPKLAAATSLSLGARLTGVLVVLLVTMGLIGAPFATAMRIGGRFGDAVIGWAWGIQVSAVAFGAALAQLAARYIGVARLFLVAAVALGLASLLATARVGRARA